jgi:hypothetical protein
MKRTAAFIIATFVLEGTAGTRVNAAPPSAVVSLPYCVSGSGGTVNAQQHTPIALRLGWFTSPKGAVNDFLQSATLDISINGVRVQNVESYWGPILQVDENVWGSVWLFRRASHSPPARRCRSHSASIYLTP